MKKCSFSYPTVVTTKLAVFQQQRPVWEQTSVAFDGLRLKAQCEVKSSEKAKSPIKRRREKKE